MVTSEDDLPEDMPLPQVSIGTKLIMDVADEFGIQRARLVEILETITNDDLLDHGVEIHERYTKEWGDNAIILNTGIWQMMYVYSDEWDEISNRLDLTENEFLAAKACHKREADHLIQEVDAADATDYLQTMDYLMTPTPLVCKFYDAGLSRQQSLIQTLRMAGITQERIAERFGNATGTIKSHCDRIDRKIESARELIDLVDNTGEVPRDFD